MEEAEVGQEIKSSVTYYISVSRIVMRRQVTGAGRSRFK